MPTPAPAALRGSTTGADAADGAGALPTDKLLDVSALALRMSSPFNAGYWLAAA